MADRATYSPVEENRAREDAAHTDVAPCWIFAETGGAEATSGVSLVVFRALKLALLFVVATPALASAQAIDAVIGLPGEPTGRVLRVRVDLGGARPAIEGCVMETPLRCTRTRRVELDRAARAELEALLAAIRAMPRCEPVGFAPGDPEFALTLPGESRPRRGHLPRDPSLIAERTDDACEAEHALAAWIVRRF